MTPDALREELGRGELRGAYLVVGEETLLRDDAVAAIRSAVLGEGPSDFDFDRLDGARATPGALTDALRTVAVVAPRRLVLLRDPDAGRGDRKLGDALAELVPGLAEAADAVLVVAAEKVDARSRWVKAFGKGRVDCAAPRSARDVASFARAEAKRQGVKLGRGAAELLAERVGPQLLVLRHEIAKAALFAGPDRAVTREHVAAGSPDVSEEKIWDLTDAIGEGRTGDALATLGKLTSAGAPPPLLLGSLGQHFRRLLRTRSGGSVPGPPFVRRKLESQASRYSERRLVACLRAIHRTDLALKGEGNLPQDLALERLVLAIAGR